MIPSFAYQLLSLLFIFSLTITMSSFTSTVTSRYLHTVPERLLTFVSQHMAKAGCAAHDFAHCKRVANLAVRIAEQETTANVKVTYLAGLIHDVLDSKLYGADHIAEVELDLRNMLKEPQTQLTEDEIDLIFVVIKSVGYKNLIKPDWDTMKLPIEYRCVQDADLLDAIGAIGIGRCFSFGGKNARRLFGQFSVLSPDEKLDPAVYAQYQKDATSNTVAHFFDKLLRLKDMMSTPTGKAMAKDRHEAMVVMLKSMDQELIDAEDDDAGVISKYISLFDHADQK